MKFSWLRFCQQHGIPFVDRGANVKKGWINIKCPWCGASDSSEHMGLDPESTFYGCWRNQGHRGRNAAQLVGKLLGISMAEARELVGETSAPELESFNTIADQLKSDLGSQVVAETPAVIKMSPELAPLAHTETLYSARRFHAYMVVDRGFPESDLNLLYGAYDLRFAVTGDFRDRIVFPFYIDRQLVTWIGRAIHPDAILRYRDLEKEKSVIYAKETLYNYDNARQGGQTLALVEGAFDVLKLDFYGAEFGVRAVARNTKAISVAQKNQLIWLKRRFRRVVNITDMDDWASPAEAMQLTADLAEILGTVDQCNTPFGKKDPGALLPFEVGLFAKELSA